jgi:hypothetical protein
MQAPPNSGGHPHAFVAVTQHPATASAGIAPHLGQLDATQPAPLDPLLDVLPPELDDAAG